MRKIILEMEYFIKSMIFQMLKFFKKNSFSLSRDDPKTFILLTGLLIFNSLKQKELIFNFFVNSNWKKINR